MSNDEISPEQYGAEYGASRQRIRTLASGNVDPTTRVPACPDWSLLNICSHLTGICRDLVERNNPGDDVQAWVDRQVAERSGRTIASVLDEWDEFSPRFETLIAKYPKGFSGLVLDVVAHEHDIGGALRVTGDRTSSGVRACMMVEARQILGRDLPAHGLPAARFVANGEEWVCGTGPVELTLDLSDRPDGTWELTRLLGSRRSLRQLRAYPWQGDLDRFLPGLAHMPLPDNDLVE